MTTPRISVTNTNQLTPPAGLVQRILQRIEIEKMHQAIRRSLMFWVSVTCLATAGLATAGFFFFQEAASSGFSTYVSQVWALANNNPALVFNHWQDIVTSIGEALPVVGLVGIAVAIGFTFWSFDKVIGFSRKWRAV